MENYTENKETLDTLKKFANISQTSVLELGGVSGKSTMDMLYKSGIPVSIVTGAKYFEGKLDSCSTALLFTGRDKFSEGLYAIVY